MDPEAVYLPAGATRRRVRGSHRTRGAITRSMPALQCPTPVAILTGAMWPGRPASPITCDALSRPTEPSSLDHGKSSPGKGRINAEGAQLFRSSIVLSHPFLNFFLIVFTGFRITSPVFLIQPFFFGFSYSVLVTVEWSIHLVHTSSSRSPTHLVEYLRHSWFALTETGMTTHMPPVRPLRASHLTSSLVVLLTVSER